MTDLIFPGHKSRKNAKSVKIKSAVRKTKKHDRSADRQMTDLIFRDTLVPLELLFLDWYLPLSTVLTLQYVAAPLLMPHGGALPPVSMQIPLHTHTPTFCHLYPMIPRHFISEGR